MQVLLVGTKPYKMVSKITWTIDVIRAKYLG